MVHQYDLFFDFYNIKEMEEIISIVFKNKGKSSNLNSKQAMQMHDTFNIVSTLTRIYKQTLIL